MALPRYAHPGQMSACTALVRRLISVTRGRRTTKEGVLVTQKEEAPGVVCNICLGRKSYYRVLGKVSEPMTFDLDIYRAAALLIMQHGEGALERAQMRALELCKAGDEIGCAVYLKILEAIVELQRGRGPGEPMH
jgi:hypothetical protein